MYAKTFFSVPPFIIDLHRINKFKVRSSKNKMRNFVRKLKSTRIHGFQGKRWFLFILVLIVIGQAYGLFYAFARIFIYEKIPEKYIVDTRWNIGRFPIRSIKSNASQKYFKFPVLNLAICHQRGD